MLTISLDWSYGLIKELWLKWMEMDPYIVMFALKLLHYRNRGKFLTLINIVFADLIYFENSEQSM